MKTNKKQFHMEQELDIEDWGECKVVYRHYATLYFIFIVDRQESDLGILDLIQVSTHLWIYMILFVFFIVKKKWF